MCVACRLNSTGSCSHSRDASARRCAVARPAGDDAARMVRLLVMQCASCAHGWDFVHNSLNP